MFRRCLSLFLAFSLAISPTLWAQEAAVADKSDEKQEVKSASEKEKTRKRPKITVAELTLSGGLSEGPSPTDIFTGANSSSLMSFIDRLKKAEENNKVRSILLRIKGGVGRAQLNELRQAISDVRDAGKMVYASMESATPAEYLIASACDKIMMPESGSLILPGIRAEVTFYKNLLDKLSIEADMLQVGEFKGAAEPMTRASMSDALRQQMETVLSDYYAQMVTMISADRGLDEDKVKETMDRGILTPKEAAEAGLIDMVNYDDAWEATLLAGSKDHELDLIENFGKKKVDTDFSGMGGFIKLMELLSGGRKSSAKSKQDKKIAIVYAVGAITSGKSSSGGLMGEPTMGSDTIVKALDDANEDEDVAAIVLRVDSPGGSALASDLIWNKIQKIEKPVIASMGNVAASGGYYISMGCDKILADRGTLTGSIGVVGGKIVIGKLMNKLGVTTDVIAYGKNSDMFSANEPFSEEGRRLMQAHMDDIYRQFTEKAAAGRKMELDELLKLAGGRVWTGVQAKENGLVDELGSLNDAIREAQKMAKLSTSEEPNLMILPEQRSFFEELFGGADVQAATQIQAASALLPTSVRSSWNDLQTLQRLFEEPTLMLMPYRVEIK